MPVIDFGQLLYDLEKEPVIRKKDNIDPKTMEMKPEPRHADLRHCAVEALGKQLSEKGTGEDIVERMDLANRIQFSNGSLELERGEINSIKAAIIKHFIPLMSAQCLKMLDPPEPKTEEAKPAEDAA